MKCYFKCFLVFAFVAFSSFASAKKTEFTYDDFKVNIIAGPYLTCVGEENLTAVFLTDFDAQGWMEYAEINDGHFYRVERPHAYESPLGKKLHGLIHKVTLERKGEKKAFAYRVIARRVVLIEGYQGVHGFFDGHKEYPYKKRPPEFSLFLNPKKESVKFALIGNLNGEGKMAQVMLKDEISSCNFVFFNGNFSKKNQPKEEFVKNFLKPSTDNLRQTPIFFSRGANETTGWLRNNYSSLFPSSTGETYYSFKTGPLFVIVLDAFDVPNKSPDGIYDVSGFLNAQANWLSKVLDSEEFKNSKFKIAVMNAAPNLELGKIFKDKILQKISDAKINCLISSGEEFSFEENSECLPNVPVLINAASETLILETDAKNMKFLFKAANGESARENIVLKNGASAHDNTASLKE